MTKKAGILVLIIALFSGLLASATVMKYVRQLRSNQQQVSETVPVLIAVVDIPAGSNILDSQVTTVQRNSSTLPPSAIQSLKEARGRIVRSTIFRGEPITQKRLIKPGSMGGLPSLIPKGMRAITLKVDDTISVAGFVRPGHYVDVLSTVDVDDELGKTITKTILQSVQVLATGHEIENKEGEKNAKLVPTVTVLVTLEQAERLALASNAGSIRLVLRNFNDLTEISTEGASLASLIPQTKREEPLPSPVLVEEAEPEPTPIPMQVVEVYRGVEKSEVTFPR